MVSVLNSVLPVFAVIGLGAALRRLRVIDDAFMGVSDRLVYYVLFPALLFRKIGKPTGESILRLDLVAAVLLSVFIVFLLSLLFAKVSRMPSAEVGSFSQGCFRFSTYIGMAAVLGALGEDGIREFGVLIGFVIPFINLLAVPTLIWFSGREYGWDDKLRYVGRSVLSNPLILACVAGILYSRLGTPLPVFLDNSLGLMSMIALPLALISIGGSMTFLKFKGHFGNALAAAVIKLVVMPIIGLAVLRIFDVTGTAFKVGLIFCALPTSPNTYILSSQLDSDVDVAAAGIVLSALLSIVSLSIVTLFLAASP